MCILGLFAPASLRDTLYRSKPTGCMTPGRGRGRDPWQQAKEDAMTQREQVRTELADEVRRAYALTPACLPTSLRRQLAREAVRRSLIETGEQLMPSLLPAEQAACASLLDKLRSASI
jgi:hypothetical protein